MTLFFASVYPLTTLHFFGTIIIDYSLFLRWIIPMLELLKNPSYLPSFIVAVVIVGIFLFKTLRIFWREGVIQHIKDDWTYRLPYRIQHNRFRGASRPAYVLICCLYYPIKSLFLLVLAIDIYCIKFFVWDIWKWLFRFEGKSWYKKMYNTKQG